VAPEAVIPGSPILEESDAGGGRTGRRLVRVLSDLLRRVRVEGEQVIAVSEGVEVVPWRKRVPLGFTWAFAYRVALVFTDRRLIEVALSPWGRRCTGLVRELSWASSPQPSFDGRNLTIGAGASWWLRRPLGQKVISQVMQASKAEIGKAGRASTASNPWRLCPKCGVTVTVAGARCRSCGSIWRSRRLAAVLAVAFPGAGKMFLGRPFYAILRFILEIACLVLYWDQLLRADNAARTVAVVAIAVVLAVLIKAESIRLTRTLAERSGIISEAVARRWRRLLPIGFLITLVAVTTPLFLGGLSGTEITGDLDAEAAHLGWSVNRSPEATEEVSPPDDASLRGVWSRDQGLVVRARAQPFLPFERLDAARERWLGDYQARQPLDIGQLQLGGFDVIRVVMDQTQAFDRIERPVTEQQPGPELVRLELLLLDARGRDAHTLTTEVAEPELAEADAQLQQLLRCMYWIDAYQ
jgi:hypothetical protein